MSPSLVLNLFLLNAMLVATTAFVVVPQSSQIGASSRVLLSRASTPLYASSDDEVVQDELAATTSEDDMYQREIMSSDVSVAESTAANSTIASTGDEGSQEENVVSNVDRENAVFECDHTVAFWQEHNRAGKSNAEYARELSSITQRFVSKGPEATNYFVRHLARCGFFAGTTALGGVASIVHEIAVNQARGGQPLSLQELVPFPTMRQPDYVPSRLVEAAKTFEQDYERIEKGAFKLPYDMYERTDQQRDPLNVAQQVGNLMGETIGILARQKRGNQEDRDTWITNEFAPSLYPRYYQTAYHYQTDGWMSSKSANVYDMSTETLFWGTQDAMQRLTIEPVTRKLEQIKSMYGNSPLRVLEVACGTGRFATFLRDNLPLDTEYTAVDLSPFYLEKAREYDQAWRKLRKTKTEGEASKKTVPLRVVQSQAENLPFNDNSFDFVVCVYLFHELPRPVRSKVAEEMARVVQPGGTVVLTDSIQQDDQPSLPKMNAFEKLNEPHYVDYLEDYLPAHFESAGLQCGTKSVCFRSKCLSFEKPLEQE